MRTVFVDGEYGTTGLEIVSRLESREDIRLLSLPVERRRDRAARGHLLNQADLAILFLCPQGCNGTNRTELFVYENEERILLVSRLDNLGKGASGAAVQNTNIALGLTESEGLC